MATSDLYGLVGQVLDGQFRVDRPIGEGGFSVVYRGQHVGLDEPVAIKCLKLQTQLGSAVVEGFIRRFRDESKIHYRLSRGSLHIARTMAAGTTMAPAMGALVPYMVLEWLDGYTLSEELRARRQRGEKGRSIQDVLRLLDPVAEAMAFAHSQGVVHRDLNPSNIFVAHAHGTSKLKVLDFGVAKVISDHALSLGPRVATIGQIRMFTPAYAAPEQFHEALGPIGPHTDVYSFAVMVVELLGDRTPIEGEHIGEFADRALDPERRPTPRAMGIDAGDAVEAVIARAVTVDPTQRPGDVGEFWGMLKNAATRDAQLRRDAVGFPKSPVSTAPSARAGYVPRVTAGKLPSSDHDLKAMEGPPRALDEGANKAPASAGRYGFYSSRPPAAAKGDTPAPAGPRAEPPRGVSVADTAVSPRSAAAERPRGSEAPTTTRGAGPLPVRKATLLQGSLSAAAGLDPYRTGGQSSPPAAPQPTAVSPATPAPPPAAGNPRSTLATPVPDPAAAFAATVHAMPAVTRGATPSDAPPHLGATGVAPPPAFAPSPYATPVPPAPPRDPSYEPAPQTSPYAPPAPQTSPYAPPAPQTSPYAPPAPQGSPYAPQTSSYAPPAQQGSPYAPQTSSYAPPAQQGAPYAPQTSSYAPPAQQGSPYATPAPQPSPYAQRPSFAPAPDQADAQRWSSPPQPKPLAPFVDSPMSERAPKRNVQVLVLLALALTVTLVAVAMVVNHLSH